MIIAHNLQLQILKPIPHIIVCERVLIIELADKIIHVNLRPVDKVLKLIPMHTHIALMIHDPRDTLDILKVFDREEILLQDLQLQKTQLFKSLVLRFLLNMHENARHLLSFDERVVVKPDCLEVESPAFSLDPLHHLED